MRAFSTKAIGAERYILFFRGGLSTLRASVLIMPPKAWEIWTHASRLQNTEPRATVLMHTLSAPLLTLIQPHRGNCAQGPGRGNCDGKDAWNVHYIYWSA